MHLASSGAAGWVLRNWLSKVDKLLLRASAGRLSATNLLTGLDVILLTTVGFRSGERRTVPLVALADRESLIVIASSFGSLAHPSWYLNLRAEPQVWVSRGGVECAYIAREAQGEERRAYWSRAVAHYPGFEAYRRRAGGREIPVIVLEPADGPAPT
jgi:deazaflavin-dependent oxidoreductase (nitroreductase family)